MQTLANRELDKSYNAKKQEIAQQLSNQPIGVQIATDGWKKKGVNDSNKLLKFIAALPDGGSSFLGVEDTKGLPMTGEEIMRFIDIQINKLVEMLQDIDKVLGIISDGEAAVRLALRLLEEKYPRLVNMACQVSWSYSQYPFAVTVMNCVVLVSDIAVDYRHTASTCY